MISDFEDEDPDEWLRITELHFPLDPKAAPRTITKGWLPVIAGLQSHEIKDFLKKKWSSFQQPFLLELTTAVLDRDLLCLSIDSQGNQWLSFKDAISALHLAPPSVISNDLRSQFPFHEIPGLTDFVENFGGLANWTLPPCPWFVPATECNIVSNECSRYDWGMIGEWAGSLTLYNTCSGNFIVVSPNDNCGKWDHDIGWGHVNEDPFYSLDCSTSDLIKSFVAYLSLRDDQVKDSPFYY